MLDFQSILFILFVASMSLFLYKNKKKISVQKVLWVAIYFVMYRSRWGLKAMDSLAKKWKKPLRFLSPAFIIIAFLGMILITVELVKNLLMMVRQPQAVSGVGVVLPIQAKGVFYVPFLYWIISIFIIAVFHEFSHGLLARAWNIRLKSSGFAFLGVFLPVLPAAFVEPDEKQLSKSSVKSQLAVFSAGPLINIILGVLFLLVLSYGMSPLSQSVFNYEGILITSVINSSGMNRSSGSAAALAGMKPGEVIKEIGNHNVSTLADFREIMRAYNPNEKVSVRTNASTYLVTLGENPQQPSKPYFGITLKESLVPKKSMSHGYAKVIPQTFKWFSGLFYWLFILNIGIGLFNLVPAGPLDGGRMLLTVLQKKGKKGILLWKYISFLLFMVILMIIGWSFIK